jgi:hypothetical protein
MKRTHLIAVVVGFMASVMLAQDAFGRARMYNPRLGQFMQRDPLGTPVAPALAVSPEPIERSMSSAIYTRRDPQPAVQYADGMNLYQYVGGHPTMLTDPSGLYKVCCRGIKDPNSIEKPFRHCQMENGECGEGEESYDVWKDPSSTRKLDDGCTTCDKATDAQIAECVKRHPYSATPYADESYGYGNNCQSSVIRTLAYCCLKSNWLPNWYAGDRTRHCKKWKWIWWPRGTAKICVEWEVFPGDFYDPKTPTTTE